MPVSCKGFLTFCMVPYYTILPCYYHTVPYSWEQWILRVVVNNTPQPIANDSAAVIERQRRQVGHFLSVV